MRPLIHIPLAFLILLTVFVGWVLLRAVPFSEPFAAAPPDPLPESPELGWGALTLEGRLIDADGAPQSEASLFSLLRGRPLWAATDESGAFVLEGVDPGPLELAVMARGFPSQVRTVDVQPHAPPLEIVLTERIPPPPELRPGPTADLVGWVELPLAGSPKGEYQLLLQPLADPSDPRSPIPRREALAADGTFRVAELALSEYRVVLLPPHARDGHGPNLLTSLDGEAPILTHGTDPDPLQLNATAGALSGRASSRSSAAPRPLEGALIQIEPFSEGGGAPPTLPAISTAADGSWRLDDLPPGRYRLRLTAGSDRREAVVTVQPGKVTDAGL